MSKVNGDNSPVFEMILESLDNGSVHQATATPSDKPIFADWQAEHQEGQLAVDVAQTETELVIVSTMAGAETDKIEVYIHNDLLTVRGVRNSPLADFLEIDFFHQECFWGKFSRTIVLPVEVKADSSVAEYKNGVLTIRVPKRKVDAKIPIVIIED